jgi:hypothetical protein
MAGFITLGSEYNGQESLDIIIRPHEEALRADGIQIIATNKGGSIKLGFFGKLRKQLMPWSSGWDGGSGSTIVEKKFELEEFKAEAAYSKQTYKDTVYETVTNVMGVAQNDITGTSVHDAELLIHGRAVLADIDRIWWFGDKTKRHDAAGTYADGTTTFAIGDADQQYNQINGVWKHLFDDAVAFASAGQDDVRRITIANGAVVMVDTISCTGTSGTAAVTIKGKSYTATFATSLTVTAAAFVTSFAAELLQRRITVTSAVADIILTSTIAGVSLGTTSALVNATGDLAGTTANTTANTVAADLTTDEAKDTFISMYRNSTKELKALKNTGQLRYYVSESMHENYEDTLISGTTENARTKLIDGIDRYMINGIPIIPMGWDSIITDDFEGGYPHRAILTGGDNLVKVLASDGDFAETRLWFNPDENENRQRTQFQFGGGYKAPEYVTVAY